jgi:hypothetical protein
MDRRTQRALTIALTPSHCTTSGSSVGFSFGAVAARSAFSAAANPTGSWLIVNDSVTVRRSTSICPGCQPW